MTYRRLFIQNVLARHLKITETTDISVHAIVMIPPLAQSLKTNYHKIYKQNATILKNDLCNSIFYSNFAVDF